MKNRLQVDQPQRVTIITPQMWKISAWSLRYYNETELNNTLKAINSAGGGNFYFLDYYRKKIIVESPSSLILCGYSKAEVDKMGFDFFQHILTDEEWSWLDRVNLACYKFFFNYSKERRQDILFSYDLTARTAKGKDLVLRHNVVPYKLCKNGNLWLSLCHAWASPKSRSGEPYILDRKTGERYDFIDDTFVKSQTLLLTQDEIAILSLMVQELSDEKMCELLEISSVANFKYKKRMLFQKLDVSTSVGAVHKAHLMGVI